MAVLITILQIIGIVFACIGGFIAFAAVTPFRYSAAAAYHGVPEADVKASWLLGLVRIFVTYSGEKPHIWVKVLFFTVFDSEKKKKKKRKKKKSKRKSTDKPAVRPIDSESKPAKANTSEELFELPDDEAQDEEKSFKDKFISVMDKITGFLHSAGEKVSAAAVWLDEDHRRLIAFLWTNGLSILKKVKPKHIEADVSGGTGDPSSTGMIVGIASMILGFTGLDTVRLQPDFEEKRIDADVNVSGYFFVFPVVWIALRIYRNKDFRKFILKK